MFQQVSFEERGKPAGVLLYSANSAHNSEIMQSPDVQAIILAYSKLTPQEQIAVQHSAQLVAVTTVGLPSQTPAEATSSAPAVKAAHITAHAPEPAHTTAPAPEPSHTLAPAPEPTHTPASAPAPEPAHTPAPAPPPELVTSPEPEQNPAPALALVPGNSHMSESAPALKYPYTPAPPPAEPAHKLAPEPESAPAPEQIPTPVSEAAAAILKPTTHALEPARTTAPPSASPFAVGLSAPMTDPKTPNHLPHSAMDSINISGLEFLPPGTPPDTIPQRQSTPLEHNYLSNPLYDWSSPATCTSQHQPFDTRFSSNDVMRRLATQEFEIQQFKLQQSELLKRIEALENASIAFAAASPYTCSTTASRRPQEVVSDRDLLRVKAALFVVGRPLTSDYCKELVTDIYENEPALNYSIDTIRAINESKRCSDAPALSKWAVLELFSLGELMGRNCTGRSSTGGVDKLPLDRVKLKFIRESVLEIYPQRSEGARRDVWNKCVEKINSQLRYLFQTSLTKHPWLNIGL